MILPFLDVLVWVRGVHFAATLLVAGTVCFTVLVGEPSRRLTLMIWAALGATILTGAIWLALIAAKILDLPLADIWRDDGLWTVVTDTRFGQVACLRLVLAVSLGVLLAASAFRGRAALQMVLVAALAGLVALVGHAGATTGPAGLVHLTSDIVHVVAAAAWLGGLPALAMSFSTPAAASKAAAITARFSVLGILAVGSLLASGLINSWRLLGGPGDLIATAYGRVLAVKIVLFGAMIAVAAINRLHLTPRLPDLQAIKALRRNSLIETAFGFAVLMLAGALGTMVPTGHAHTNLAVASSEAAFVHIHTEAVMADVTIDPGHTGKSTATIRLLREDYSEYPTGDVKIVIEPREGRAPSIERSATRTPDGTWQIESMQIPSAGVWILRLTIGAATGPAVVLDAPIVITQCSNECW